MAEPRSMTKDKRYTARSARWENIARSVYRFRSNTLSMVGLAMLIFILLVAIFAPVIAPYPEDAAGKTRVSARLQPPSEDFAFGTDKVGRDIFSRVVMGTGLALQVGTIIILLATTIGVTIGAISGYAGGWLDDLLMRFNDIFLTVPALVLAIAISAALGKGIINAMLGIALVWWPGSPASHAVSSCRCGRSLSSKPPTASAPATCALSSVTSCQRRLTDHHQDDDRLRFRRLNRRRPRIHRFGRAAADAGMAR